MTRPLVALVSAIAACVIATVPAFACIGQIKVSLGSAEPGALIQVRGYGFWADPRPVSFTWDDGATVTTVEPDASGVFNITLAVPEAEGSYRLVATQGENDPEPAYHIVRVVRAAPTTDGTAAVQPMAGVEQAASAVEQAASSADVPATVTAPAIVNRADTASWPRLASGAVVAVIAGGALAIALVSRLGLPTARAAATRLR